MRVKPNYQKINRQHLLGRKSLTLLLIALLLIITTHRSGLNDFSLAFTLSTLISYTSLVLTRNKIVEISFLNMILKDPFMMVGFMSLLHHFAI